MLFAMTERYESTGDVWKAMDCLTEKLMEQAADRVKAETAGNNMVIGKNMEQLCGRLFFICGVWTGKRSEWRLRNSIPDSGRELLKRNICMPIILCWRDK